tara:strand:+ start:308 stop:508 length:201 start_codon:yes stop_codon:yes gene_type:complete
MQNNLPEIGKKYQAKNRIVDGFEIEVVGIYRPRKRYQRIIVDDPRYLEPINYTFEDFWDKFEVINN